MLKRHQAIIDLAKDALVIQGREIRFLSEHELPKAFQGDDEMELDECACSHLTAFASGSIADGAVCYRQGNPIPPPAPPAAPESTSNPAPAPATGAPFPGSGHSLANPTPAPAPSTPARAPAPAAFPEASITSLVNLGVTREEAIRYLEASGGNTEMAANLVFSGGMD